jgi:hypothetical protein
VSDDALDTDDSRTRRSRCTATDDVHVSGHPGRRADADELA